MKYSAAEVKSGAFIVFAAVLLLIMTFVVGGYLGGDTKVWDVRFGYVGGLEEGSPVYYAGREVGKVDKIVVLAGKERPIVVTLRVSVDIILRDNTQVYIDTLGMMGEKIIELSPGSEDAPLLQEGATMEGTDPIPMHVMIRKMNLLADRMDEMTASLNPFIVEIQQFMHEDIAPLMESVDGAVNQVNGILSGNSENLALMIANFTQTSANLRDMTQDLKYRPWRLMRKNS